MSAHEHIPPPLCVWCGEPWTDDTLKVAEVTVHMDYGYDPGEFYLTSADAVIEATCGHCGKAVLRREVRAAKVDHV